MNRKSQIPIILLPVAAFALAAGAIFIMYTFSKGFNSQEEQINLVLTTVQFNQDYINAQAKLIGNESLSKCPSCSPEQLKQKFREIGNQTESNFRYEGAGNFYAKIRNSEFDIAKENGKYTLKMQGLFVESENGFNKIHRNFDLNLTLN
jgi:hypothetical protein